MCSPIGPAPWTPKPMHPAVYAAVPLCVVAHFPFAALWIIVRVPLVPQSLEPWLPLAASALYAPQGPPLACIVAATKTTLIAVPPSLPLRLAPYCGTMRVPP